MVKQFSGFWGYDLKTGSQIIAVISGIFCCILAPLLLYAAWDDAFIQVDEEHSPIFQNYGSVGALKSLVAFMGAKQIVHLIFCISLFSGLKTDYTVYIRVWLKSNVIGLCIMGVFGTYCTVLLFAAGLTGAAVGAVFILLIFIPTKIYFGLVVNSYHKVLVPNHIWGANMNVEPTYHLRSCQLVPPIQANRPTVIVAV